MNFAYLPMYTLGQDGNLASSVIVKVKSVLYFEQRATLWFHIESQLLIGVWLLPGTFFHVFPLETLQDPIVTRHDFSYCDSVVTIDIIFLQHYFH